MPRIERRRGRRHTKTNLGCAGRLCGNGGNRRRRTFLTVERQRAGNIAGLGPRKFLAIAEIHQDAGNTRMIKPDGVADLVLQSIAEIVDVEVAVKADLPLLRRLRQMTDRAITAVASPDGAACATLVKARPNGSASAPIRISAVAGSAGWKAMLATADQAAKACSTS